MISFPGSPALVSRLGDNFPRELNSLVDFVADDDRPTLILDHATTNILYCNNAFDSLKLALSQDSSSPSWLASLLEAACHGTRPHPHTTEKLATLVNRRWSRKSIGSSWTAVTCLGPVDHTAERAQDASPAPEMQSLAGRIPGLPTTRQGFSSALPVEANPLKRQRSDDGSITSVSTNASSVADMNTPLEHLSVDWLLRPDLTPDPWLDILNNHNWQDKTVGPIHTWPTMLRQMYTTILASEEPRILYWGNQMLMLYNEKARFVTGELQLTTLGEPLIDAWGEQVYTELVRMVRTGVKRGKPVVQKDHEFILSRYGYTESAYFDVVLLPIPSPDGHFLGVLTEFTEVTEKFLQRSRAEVSRTLLKNISKATDLRNLWQIFVDTLRSNPRDLSYAVVYTTTSFSREQGADTLQLEASCNIGALQSHPPPTLVAALQHSTNEVFALQRSKNTLPPELAISVADIGSVDVAYVLPIVALDGVRLSGVVVLGLNPRRAISPSVRQFVESIRDMLFKSSALFSLPMEQRASNEISQALSQQLESMTLKAEASEQNFTRMLRDAPIGMCMHREDGHCVYVNDVCLELLGMSKVEFYRAAEVGLAWRTAVHDDDIEIVDQIWSSAIEKGTAVSAEFRVKAVSAPEVRWLEISAQQRHDTEGNLEYLYVWLRDISTRKQLAEEKLQDALETKRRAEVFIDMISHEMRNPLGAILLLADGISASLPLDNEPCVLTPDLRHTLLDTAANIQLCAKHMKQIAEEVLTYSRLDSKLLVLSPEKIRPSEIVQSVLKMVQAELDYNKTQGALEIQQSYIDLAIDHILLDPGRLTQIILNLMTNAIKFTKNSEKRQIVISLGASRTKPTAEDCRVMLVEPRAEVPVKAVRRLSITEDPIGENVFLMFSVRDTGCGMTPTEMGHLFHRFSQASPKTYKQYGGTGLGLFISRELVELQGGQIGVHSESGIGSTFAFYVETARIEPHVETPATELAQASISDHMRAMNGASVQRTQALDLHVLVVEDNAINQKILAQQLRKTGCAKVHVADHGLDALEILSTTTFHKSAGVEQIPLSVILLDVEMPIMDGLTCARRIRELQRAGEIVRHVPIIGITANARVEQIALCTEAGMDEVVTKPFRVMDLLPRMLALVDQHTPIS